MRGDLNLSLVGDERGAYITLMQSYLWLNNTQKFILLHLLINVFGSCPHVNSSTLNRTTVNAYYHTSQQ